jgi:hypothetical protein
VIGAQSTEAKDKHRETSGSLHLKFGPIGRHLVFGRLHTCGRISQLWLTACPEPLILLVIEQEPNPAAPVLDAVLQRLAALKSHAVATALGKSDNLSGIREGQLFGKCGFQFRFQELAVAAASQHEIHVHTMEVAI